MNYFYFKKKYKLKDVLNKEELKSNLKKISQDFFSKEEVIKIISMGKLSWKII